MGNRRRRSGCCVKEGVSVGVCGHTGCIRKRMMFELTEDISVLLVYQRVKGAIESVHPKGVLFFKATQWNSDRTFEK